MKGPLTRPLKKPPRDCRPRSGLFWGLSVLGGEVASAAAGSTHGAGSLVSCLLLFCLSTSAVAFLSFEGPSLHFWAAPAGSGSGGVGALSVESDIYREVTQSAC